ncbi:MAG: hypothetical protein U1F36_09140 [Planctomycetota bacterium]
MRATRQPDGSIRLTQVEWVIAEILGAVPDLIESEDPKVHARFHPRTYADDVEDAQWRELVGPELRRLFASRAEIVRGDLLAMVAEDDADSYAFAIPAGHLSAWEAALVGASHALYGKFGLAPDELREGPTGSGDPLREDALLRVEVQSAVLHLLIRVADPSFGRTSVDIDEDTDDEPE